MRKQKYWIILLPPMIALLLIVSTTVASGSAFIGAPEAPGAPAGGGGAVGPGFTYQGYLTNAGVAVNAVCDFRFALFTPGDPGTQIGTTQTLTGIVLVDGYFTVLLNPNDEFTTNPFNGSERRLQIWVKCPWDKAYVDMGRVDLTITPYAAALRPGAHMISGGTVMTATASTDFGLIGETNSTQTGMAGLVGRHLSETGEGYGVYGITSSSGIGASGVYGYAESNLDRVYGVNGVATSDLGAGVRAENTNISSYSPDLLLAGTRGVLTTDYAIPNSELIFNSNFDVTFYIDKNNDDYGTFRINTLGPGSVDETIFAVNDMGDVYADRGFNCGLSYSGTGTGGTLLESDISICLNDESPADFAEMLPATNGLEPGDVLVVGGDGKLALSDQPYQATVVGVFSTRPSYLGNSRFAGQTGYVPLAMVGVVPVKATALGGPIQPGDLLTTSAVPGHAMRCEGLERCFGRTIGKALEALPTGEGVIQVLVMLQ